MAQPVALKELMQAKTEKESEEKPRTPPKIARLKAGQTVPGGTRSTLHLVQGALGKLTGPAWVTRRKLGIDRSSIWDSS